MDSRRLPDPDPAALDAARRLARHVAGEVLTSPLSRWLYSTDASIYRLVPDAVLVARSVDDLAAAAVVAGEAGVTLCIRGAATSLAGQTLGGRIAVDCFHLDRIVVIEPERRTAIVEPGVIQASLNRAAAPYGLEFGPDTSTVDQATLGGMAGNNSSGSRSIVYGETKDKLRRVTAVLPGGDVVRLGQARGGDLGEGLGGSGGERLAGALAQLRERARQPLAACAAETRRCTSGYNLRELIADEPNLGRLLAGSEGTLALFAELEVELDPRPALRLGWALTFATLRAALDANVAILATRPSAVELLDLDPLRRAPSLGAFRGMAPLLAGDEQAMLTVEYQGDADDVHAGLERLARLLPELPTARAVRLDDAVAWAEAAALRRAALPLLMGAPGAERPASFVEDTCVAPERLAGFVADFQRVVAGHGVRASFTGHASAGCLHIRPLLDLKTAAGVATMGTLARDVGRLVADHLGLISGEHGCGRSRSWFLPELLGDGLFAAMVACKDAFDPRRLLTPGVIVGAQDVTESLRYGADYHGDGAWAPRLSYAAEGGFDLAIEKCFGAGLCKKTTGTMCPPAAVDRDEPRSTRARANALQGVLCGAIPPGEIGEREFAEVLGTCVACKACKSECPAGVDMAALKVEWLAEVRARGGMPPLARAIADFRHLAALGSAAAPLVDLFGDTWPARALADRLGVAHDRPLPAFARRTLTRRLAAAGASPAAGAADLRHAVLFVDCFVQYQEPQIGEALAVLLRHAGVSLEPLDAGCCGRTALSTGAIDKARAAARRALGLLHEAARAGHALLFVEPSCLSMVLDDWPRLLPGDPRLAEVAAAARPALALVADLAEAGALAFKAAGPPSPPAAGDAGVGSRVLLHSHCHEKSLGFAADTLRALAAVPGLEVEALDAGCCGMSGVFGYEAAHYDTSVAIAERVLLPAVRAAMLGGEVAVLATGTSCRTQIGDLAARRALHPLEFLAQRVLP